MNKTEVESFFESITKEEKSFQSKYWSKLKPINDSETFQRYLFAFTSVHTTWERNVIGYNAIKDWWNWINRWDILGDRLKESRIGLHNNRLKFISKFTTNFWSNPSYYIRREGEVWSEFRNRIVNNITGLGMAKASFAVEMIYPDKAEVVCLDTHLFQAYGLNQTKHHRQYNVLENHWIDNSYKQNIPPYIARCIYWDRKQGKQDSRYWSHALEEGDLAIEMQSILN